MIGGPDTAPFLHEVINNEVRRQGILSDSFVEEYPHIYSLPLLSRGYCDFLSEQVDLSVLGKGSNYRFCCMRTAMQEGVLEQFESEVMPVVSDLVSTIFTQAELECWEDPLAERMCDHSGQDAFRMRVEDISNLTMLIVLQDDCEGGYIAFPKFGEKRYRGLSPNQGCALVFPSALEYCITEITHGNKYLLQVPLHLIVPMEGR